MHREAGGLVQPISTHRRRGLSCHLHANGVSGGDENGAGAGGHAVLLVEEVFEGAAQHSTYNPSVWKTICWSSSGPASRSIYTLLNQTRLLDTPPPPLPLLWHTDTARPLFKHKLVYLISYC